MQRQQKPTDFNQGRHLCSVACTTCCAQRSFRLRIDVNRTSVSQQSLLAVDGKPASKRNQTEKPSQRQPSNVCVFDPALEPCECHRRTKCATCLLVSSSNEPLWALLQVILMSLECLKSVSFLPIGLGKGRRLRMCAWSASHSQEASPVVRSCRRRVKHLH